jgi:hypothetical protein
MTLCLPGLPVSLKYCLASFQADSTASPPPVVKNTRLRSPGAIEAIRSASSTARGWAKDQSGKNASSLACLAAASASSSRPWPTWTTNRPARPSMYSRPWLSQILCPSPFTMSGISPPFS